jgi:hypothetical protein
MRFQCFEDPVRRAPPKAGLSFPAAQSLALAWILVALSARLPATTVALPGSFADLAKSSEAVVLARALDASSLRKSVWISTRTDFEVLRALSGPLQEGARFTAEVPGGEVDGETWLVPGSPRFQPGESYLLCLRLKSTGLWQPTLLACGALRETEGAGGSYLLSPVEESFEMAAVPGVEGGGAAGLGLSGSFEEEAFLELLSQALEGRTAWDPSGARAGDTAESPGGTGAAVPAGCSFFSSDGMNFRWSAFDSGGVVGMRADATGDFSLAGGGFRELQEAMGLWMAISGTSVNLVYEGPVDLAIDCAAGGAATDGAIVFNDPCSEMQDAGILAVGGPIAAGTHNFDGATWLTITGWIVIVNDGAGSIGVDNYRLVLAHEMGHGLGYGHVEDGAALMYAICCNAVNATDTRCARYAYPPSDSLNKRPVVDAGGDLDVAVTGSAVRLHGTATDDGRPPGGEPAAEWRQLGGPAPVRFEDPSAPDTRVVLPRSGTYLLGLEADDGALLNVGVMEVTARVLVGSQASVTLQEGRDGYSGTVDTTLKQSAPGAAAPRALQLRVDGDDPSGSGQDTQALLRFEGIFGGSELQIPPGAAISSAWLDLTSEDPGDGATFHRMSREWLDSDTWSTFGGNGLQAGVEALSAPDGRASGLVQDIRVDVTKSLAAWSEDPCGNLGWALLPVGDNGWLFSSSEGASPPRLTVEHSAVRREQAIGLGDTWAYFKGTRDPPEAWKENGFTPGAGWAAGPTGIGFGDGDDATVLRDMQGSYVTVYCRKDFIVSSPSEVGRLTLAMDYDDGFVAYLNGVEAARSSSLGSPGTPVGRSTPADSREAGSIEEYRLDPARLVAGTNSLAVEVHNASLSSSDLSFLPELFMEFLTIPEDAEWKFWKGTSAPPASWNSIAFDDSAWPAGRTGIGYGDGDDFTELTDMRGSYASLFLRRAFNVLDPSRVEGLRLTVVYDDGSVVYLNGTEIARWNMPAGAVGHATPAQSALDAGISEVDLPRALLRAGTNVLAASVHNAALDSSDLSFMPVLIPVLPRPSPVFCGIGFQRGDASSDGSVDIADAIQVLLFLFGGGDPLACPDAGDIDDDGVLRLTDAILLLGYLFRGGSTPAAPGLQCGEDPTSDALGSCATQGCF